MEDNILLLQLDTMLESWLDNLNQTIVGSDANAAARATAAKGLVLQLLIRIDQRRKEGIALDERAIYVLENMLPALLGTLPQDKRASLNERERLIRAGSLEKQARQKAAAEKPQKPGDQALAREAFTEIALEVTHAAEARIAEEQAARVTAVSDRDEALERSHRAEARAADAEVARDLALAERDAALNRLREMERAGQAAPQAPQKNKPALKPVSPKGAEQGSTD